MDYKEASARTILETPHSAPFPGFSLESHPPRSQIRQPDKGLNESPPCMPANLLRLCTHSLQASKPQIPPNFTFLRHSEDTVHGSGIFFSTASKVDFKMENRSSIFCIEVINLSPLHLMWQSGLLQIPLQK